MLLNVIECYGTVCYYDFSSSFGTENNLKDSRYSIKEIENDEKKDKALLFGGVGICFHAILI